MRTELLPTFKQYILYNITNQQSLIFINISVSKHQIDIVQFERDDTTPTLDKRSV